MSGQVPVLSHQSVRNSIVVNTLKAPDTQIVINVVEQVVENHDGQLWSGQKLAREVEKKLGRKWKCVIGLAPLIVIEAVYYIRFRFGQRIELVVYKNLEGDKQGCCCVV